MKNPKSLFIITCWAYTGEKAIVMTPAFEGIFERIKCFYIHKIKFCDRFFRIGGQGRIIPTMQRNAEHAKTD